LIDFFIGSVLNILIKHNHLLLIPKNILNIFN